MSLLENLKSTDKKGKIDFLAMIEEDEERLFHDYTEELNLLIHDQDNEVKAKAIICLWDYPTTYFLNFLLDAAFNNKDDNVRKNSIIVLGRYIFEGSMEGFDLELNDPIMSDEITKDDYNKVKNLLLSIYNDINKNSSDRRYSLEALSFASEDEIENLIEDAYNNEDKLFKQCAIFSMGRNGNTKWNEIIIKELNNPDRSLKLEAIKAAGEAKIEKAGDELIKLTESEDLEIVKSAIWSLGQTGCANGCDRLYELSESDNIEIQEIADAAIEEWHSISGTYDEEYDDNYDE